MSESTLQETIRQWCMRLRLAYYHSNDSRRDERGFLDAFILGPRGHKIRENKTWPNRNRVTPEQAMWLEMFRLLGFDAGVWTTADLEPDPATGRSLIEVELRSIAARGADRWPQHLETALVQSWQKGAARRQTAAAAAARKANLERARAARHQLRRAA
jgi:hypothetical protein